MAIGQPRLYTDAVLETLKLHFLLQVIAIVQRGKMIQSPVTSSQVTNSGRNSSNTVLKTNCSSTRLPQLDKLVPSLEGWALVCLLLTPRHCRTFSGSGQVVCYSWLLCASTSTRYPSSLPDPIPTLMWTTFSITSTCVILEVIYISDKFYYW